jgi:hypothetical protein
VKSIEQDEDPSEAPLESLIEGAFDITREVTIDVDPDD